MKTFLSEVKGKISLLRFHINWLIAEHVALSRDRDNEFRDLNVVPDRTCVLEQDLRGNLASTDDKFQS
jgi:hypothetical protein